MRLTLFIENLSPGGAERVLSAMANDWAARGHTVHAVTRPSPKPDFYRLHPAVRRVIAPDPLRWIGRPGRYLLRVHTLRQAIVASRPDVVISFTNIANVEALLATRGLKVPVIVSERCDPREQPIPPHHAVLRRLLYPHADAVVVQTESVRRWAEEFVPMERLAVVPNFVQPLTAAPSVSREPLIVAMGRLVELKGFDLLLTAFSRVARALPDWHLVILGEGKGRADLERQIAALGLGERVRLPGVTQNPQSFLRRAGLFVLSSRTEGFPNSLLEAMACGAPVVATDCPTGPSEIIRHGHDGLLVPVADVDRLAEEILRLGRSPEERVRLGHNAVEVTARFHPERIMAAWNGLCQRFIHRAGAQVAK